MDSIINDKSTATTKGMIIEDPISRTYTANHKVSKVTFIVKSGLYFFIIF